MFRRSSASLSSHLIHAQPQGHARAHRRHQGDAEDHQGHADGRGVEAAARARAAAEAARPYAQRMTKVLGNIAAAADTLGAAPPLLVGTGSDRVHLLLVCTAERGLCGPFNSAIVRLARERANALMAEGK